MPSPPIHKYVRKMLFHFFLQLACKIMGLIMVFPYYIYYIYTSLWLCIFTPQSPPATLSLWSCPFYLELCFCSWICFDLDPMWENTAFVFLLPDGPPRLPPPQYFPFDFYECAHVCENTPWTASRCWPNQTHIFGFSSCYQTELFPWTVHIDGWST